MAAQAELGTPRADQRVMADSIRMVVAEARLALGSVELDALRDALEKVRRVIDAQPY